MSEQKEQVEQMGKVIESSPICHIKKEKRPIQCKNMVITVNNWTMEQRSKLLLFFNKYCEKYIVGEEIGESGTPHLQGAFVLKKKDRFSGIHKKLGFSECHLEKMISNWEDQIEYCSKEGTNVIAYPRLYKGGDLPKKEELFDWQKNIIEIIEQPVDGRKVYWYYDLTGGCGKSVFTKYLSYYHKAVKISGGKKTDVINHVFNAGNRDLIVLDIPRNTQNASYTAIEEIKNGHISNDKYETGSVMFDNPHLIIFSNFFPDISKLSADRWQIYNINNDDPDFEDTIERYKDIYPTFNP